MVWFYQKPYNYYYTHTFKHYMLMLELQSTCNCMALVLSETKTNAAVLRTSSNHRITNLKSLTERIV